MSINIIMSHKKNNPEEQLKFYNNRLATQHHLDQGPVPLIETDELTEVIKRIENVEIVAVCTMLFNAYEEQHKHIWFSRGVRETMIATVADLVEAQRSNLFEGEGLHSVYTGMGVDDHKRKYK